MTEEEEFKNAIKYYDLKSVKKILNNKNINFTLNNMFLIEAVLNAVRKKNESTLFFLLYNDHRFNPEFDMNFTFITASEYGLIDIVSFLLKDQNITPSDELNHAIQYAFEGNHTNVVELLWKDKRVKSTLNSDNSFLYNQLITKEIKNKITSF
jgi:hypothetical protein